MPAGPGILKAISPGPARNSWKCLRVQYTAQRSRLMHLATGTSKTHSRNCMVFECQTLISIPQSKKEKSSLSRAESESVTCDLRSKAWKEHSTAPRQATCPALSVKKQKMCRSIFSSKGGAWRGASPFSLLIPIRVACMM